jgi:Na+/melibiose symporter-like transporter
LKTILGQLFKNKYLLIYYVAFFAATAANTMQFMAAYFAKSNLGDEGLTTLLLAATIIPLLITIPFLPAMIKAFGKRSLTIWCSAAFIVVSIAQYFIGYDSLIGFLALAAVRVILMNIPLQMYGMFTADCVEYGAYTIGERTEGIAFAIQTFMTKLGGAVVQWVSLFIIGIAGYIEQLPVDQAQPQRALDAIWQVMTLVPIGGFAIMLIIMVLFYDLKEKDVQRMIDEMAAKGAN